MLPARLISPREANFYFDRRIRMLAHLNNIVDLYCNATLEGILPSGLVQLRVNMNGDDLQRSGGTPIWDLETGHTLGILIGVWSSNNQVAFMALPQTIAAAWPDLEVEFAAQNVTGNHKAGAPKVFICHANEDAAAALDVYNHLASFGYEPWLDKMSLVPGKRWDFEIKKAVKEAEFFVVLLSPISVSKKGYIQKEFKLAMELLDEIPEGQIYLIPAKLDDCPVPAQFSAFQWVDLKGSDSHEQIRKAIQFQLSSGGAK